MIWTLNCNQNGVEIIHESLVSFCSVVKKNNIFLKSKVHQKKKTKQQKANYEEKEKIVFNKLFVRNFIW